MAYASTVTFVLAAGPVLAEDSRQVSLRDAHKGTLEIDLRIMNQYEVQPQAVQDFYAACRAALTGPNPEAALEKVCRVSNRWKLGGPMLGDLTSTGVAVWMHLPEPMRVDVLVTPKAGGASKTSTSAAAERFQSVRCEGLLPDTGYSYTVTDSRGRELGGGDFLTAPETLSEKPLKIAFGTCFHKVGLYRPELMKLVQERGNDTFGTHSNSKQPIDVDGLRKTWKNQWNNPDRHAERKGIYFQTHIGPVHYIALDTRSCRVNQQRGHSNSFLGKEQMTWLKQQINESTSPYILVSGGTMWSDYISNGKDSWGTWDTEGREEIFQVIDAKRGSSVILLCGDRHGARGFAIPRPGSKKIYEFEVATLGGVPGPGAFGKDKTAQLFGQPSRSWAFGEFSFRAVDGVLQATFHLVNERGEELETVVLES